MANDLDPKLQQPAVTGRTELPIECLWEESRRTAGPHSFLKQTLGRLPGLPIAYRYSRILAFTIAIAFRTKWINEKPLRWVIQAAPRLARYVFLSNRMPGWTRGEEAIALAIATYGLRDDAVVVEIGSFLGCSTVLLGGARKLRGSGRVHSVDTFDASGDDFSRPVYSEIRDTLGVSLREQFDRNIQFAGLQDWIEVHHDYDTNLARTWTRPIDLLFMDANHSYDAVRATYQAWSRFLRAGGIIAVHNSSLRRYHKSHDGSMRLVLETINPPQYSHIWVFGTTTFARKTNKHGD